MRGSTVPICLTALIIVGCVLGYAEYVRQDGLRRDRIEQLSAQKDADERALESDRHILEISVQSYKTSQSNGTAGVDDAGERRSIAADFETAVSKYIEWGTVQHELAERQGRSVAAPTPEDVANFRNSLFDASPGLDQIVKR